MPCGPGQALCFQEFMGGGGLRRYVLSPAAMFLCGSQPWIWDAHMVLLWVS